MEMGLRELLMLVGVVIIVAVAFDAFRRVRNERGPLPERDPLIQDDMPDIYTEPMTSEEFPSGGARRKTLKETLAASIAENQATENQTAATENRAVVTESPTENFAVKGENLAAAKAASRVKSAGPFASIERQELSMSDTQEGKNEGALLTENGLQHQSLSQTTSSSATSLDKRPIDKRPTEEVIVLNITAKPGEPFEGTLLHTQLLRHGLRYGDMQIFHYMEQTPKGQQIIFSAANLIEPGTLDPSQMEEMRTRGICLFLSLPGPLRPLQAFDRMLITAKNIAQQLGGDLRDETRSIMTQQTIQHTRQRVIDYERKNMMRHSPVAAVS